MRAEAGDTGAAQREGTDAGREQEGYTNFSLLPAFSLLPRTPPGSLGDECGLWGQPPGAGSRQGRMSLLVSNRPFAFTSKSFITTNFPY